MAAPEIVAPFSGTTVTIDRAGLDEGTGGGGGGAGGGGGSGGGGGASGGCEVAANSLGSVEQPSSMMAISGSLLKRRTIEGDYGRSLF